MKRQSIPQRFATASPAPSARERQGKDTGPGLVAISCKLPSPLVTQLREAALAHPGKLNGLMADLLPVWTLHGLLLPLNLWRLHQLRNLLGQVKRVSGGRFSLDMLLPYMSVQTLPAGHQIFSEGDPVAQIVDGFEARVCAALGEGGRP